MNAFTLLPVPPFAIGNGDSAIEGPMAYIILGGLLTSTVLNLLVVPTLSLRSGWFEKPKRARKR